MAFQLDDPAEAYAAIALLVLGADGVGTSEEREVLFSEFGQASVFADHDAEDFGALLGRLTGRMYDDAVDPGSPGGTGAVSEICAGARSVLDEHQCRELFSFAVKIAHSDGLHVREHEVLTEIVDGLGIDAETGRAMIDEAAG